MADEDRVREINERTERKQRGARAARNGLDFETIFGAYHIIAIGSDIFSGASGRRPGTVELYPQSLVDDLRTEDREGVTFHQLKYGQVRRLGLESDFRDQQWIDSRNNVVYSYRLIVDTDRRARAAERWLKTTGLNVHAYAFPSSPYYMAMAQLHRTMPEWMFDLTGSRNRNICSTCYDLILIQWWKEGSCDVRKFFHDLAIAQRGFRPHPFKPTVSGFEILQANLQDYDLDAELSDRQLVVTRDGVEILRVEYCSDQFFDRYNDWHQQTEMMSQRSILQKLTLEGLEW